MVPPNPAAVPRLLGVATCMRRDSATLCRAQAFGVEFNGQQASRTSIPLRPDACMSQEPLRGRPALERRLQYLPVLSISRVSARLPEPSTYRSHVLCTVSLRL